MRLAREYEAGRVGHDSRQDPERWLIQVNDALAEASTAARSLEDALNRAHNASAGLTGRGQEAGQ